MVLKNPQIFLHKQLIVSYNGEQFIKKYPSGWWLNSAVSVVTHRAVALADFPEDSHYISGILPKPPALLSPSCLPCDNIQYYQFQLHLLLLIQNSALLPQGPAVAVRQHVFQEHGGSASDSPELGFPAARQAALSGYAVLLIHGYRHLLSTVYLNMDSHS